MDSTICRRFLTKHNEGRFRTSLRHLYDTYQPPSTLRVMSPNIFGQEEVLEAEREIHLYNLMSSFGFFLQFPDCFNAISFITCFSYFPVCADDLVDCSKLPIHQPCLTPKIMNKLLRSAQKL